MTEEGLMKTWCPHARADQGSNIVSNDSCNCLGSACSQYREKTEPLLAENRCSVYAKGVRTPDDVNPDPTVWEYAFWNSDLVYFKRIVPLTLIHAWCGLAGTPPYAQS